MSTSKSNSNKDLYNFVSMKNPNVFLLYPGVDIDIFNYIDEPIDFCIGWAGDKNDECDCLDAVFYALAASGLFLEEAWASSDTHRDKPWYERDEVSESPFASFGRQARGQR